MKQDVKFQLGSLCKFYVWARKSDSNIRSNITQNSFFRSEFLPRETRNPEKTRLLLKKSNLCIDH